LEFVVESGMEIDTHPHPEFIVESGMENTNRYVEAYHRPEFIVESESGMEIDMHPLQKDIRLKLTITRNSLWNLAWKLVRNL
jgi:hypothetical protein